MLVTVKTDIVTDASGNATVHLANGKTINGLLMSMKYIPGSIATGADLTITGETSGRPILTVTNAGTSNVFYYPRALLNEVANAAANTIGTEIIPIVSERIKVVVAQGGNGGAGSIEATLLVDSPY